MNDNNTVGETLKAIIKANGYTQKEVAQIIGILPSQISEVVKGKQPFTIPFAAKLSAALSHEEIDRLIWYQIEKETEKLKETRKVDSISSVDKILSDYDNIISLTTLCNRLNIREKDSSKKLSLLQNEFDIPSVDRLYETSAGLFRKSTATGIDTRMILTWTLLAKNEARQITPSGTFAKENIATLIAELKQILNTNKNTIAKLQACFSNFGIRFCIVEKTPQASIDGYSFIEDSIPSIVLTMRYDKIDNLAFNVLHELGHVFLHLSNNMTETVSIEDYDRENAVEKEADKFANDILIPEYLWMSAPKNYGNPYVTVTLLTSWALNHGINKWIVLGRYSHDTNFYKIKSDGSRNVN